MEFTYLTDTYADAMSRHESLRTTSIARLERLRPDHLEVVYHAGCVLTTAALKEVATARRELMGDQRYAMLAILPGDTDFEVAAIEVDHLAQDRRDGLITAMAVVARANMIEMLLKLYFAHFPLLDHLLVTDKEDEARAWIRQRLEEMAGASGT